MSLMCLSRRIAIAISIASVIVIAPGCRRSAEQQPKPASGSGGAETTPPASSAPPQQSADTAATPAAAPEQLPSDTAIGKMLEPSKGDLDSMVERRYIRMLVTFSRTNYFLDGPEQHGATYDAGKLF